MPEPFVDRHIGPREHEIQEMLHELGYRSLDELAEAAVPANIRQREPSASARARVNTRHWRSSGASLPGTNVAVRSSAPATTRRSPRP